MSYKEALQYSMRLCALKEMCKSDIIKKIKLKGIEEEEANQIISELAKNRFIDEYRYTRAYVNDKVKFSKWGIQRIKLNLQQKEISPSIIAEICKGVEGELYYQNGMKLALIKLKSIKNDKPIIQQRKIYNLLLYRGYDVIMIWRIIKDIKLKIEEDVD